MTRHSEKAAAECPERDQERETRLRLRMVFHMAVTSAYPGQWPTSQQESVVYVNGDHRRGIPISQAVPRDCFQTHLDRGRYAATLTTRGQRFTFLLTTEIRNCYLREDRL